MDRKIKLPSGVQLSPDLTRLFGGEKHGNIIITRGISLTRASFVRAKLPQHAHDPRLEGGVKIALADQNLAVKAGYADTLTAIDGVPESEGNALLMELCNVARTLKSKFSQELERDPLFREIRLRFAKVLEQFGFERPNFGTEAAEFLRDLNNLFDSIFVILCYGRPLLHEEFDLLELRNRPEFRDLYKEILILFLEAGKQYCAKKDDFPELQSGDVENTFTQVFFRLCDDYLGRSSPQPHMTPIHAGVLRGRSAYMRTVRSLYVEKIPDAWKRHEVDLRLTEMVGPLD